LARRPIKQKGRRRECETGNIPRSPGERDIPKKRHAEHTALSWRTEGDRRAHRKRDKLRAGFFLFRGMVKEGERQRERKRSFPTTPLSKKEKRKLEKGRRVSYFPLFSVGGRERVLKTQKR